MAEDRKTESLAAYYAQLTDAQRRALHAVAMDMWEAYIGATRDGLPDGAEKIVFDRFHIMREMTKAVDTVRKQEHRAFRRAGTDSPLTGTKYLWLFSDERRPARHAAAFATLQALNLKVGRAWAIKEALRALWTYRHQAAVKRFFTRWYGWAIRSRLAPVKQVAKTLKRHLRRGAPLCHASDHEWRSRRSQQQDHEHQAKGRRLPQPVTLHDGDLFSLWRARPLPTLNPEGPLSLFPSTPFSVFLCWLPAAARSLTGPCSRSGRSTSASFSWCIASAISAI